MSGVVTGIAKTFTAVAKGVSTAVGSAVSGVGAIVGTAASAGSSIFGGGANSLIGSVNSGGGVLGHLLSGALNVATKGVSGLVDTVADAGSALFGPAAGATGAIGGGMAAGAGAAGAAGTGSSLLARAGNFLTSEQGAGLVGGIGKGLMEYDKMEQEAKEKQKDRDYLFDKEMRVRDSYNVPPEALPNGGSSGVPLDNTPRPTPAQQYGSRDFDMVYDPNAGRIVRRSMS